MLPLRLRLNDFFQRSSVETPTRVGELTVKISRDIYEAESRAGYPEMSDQSTF